MHIQLHMQLHTHTQSTLFLFFVISMHRTMENLLPALGIIEVRG